MKEFKCSADASDFFTSGKNLPQDKNLFRYNSEGHVPKT